MTVRIDGKSLTIEDVINVSRHYEKVEITEDAKITVNRSRDYVREKLENDAVIYGLTTGFGRFANVKISFEDTAQLQKNLIRSHTCAMGECFERKYVRTAMLLRCNALVRGNSGIRLSTIQTMIDSLSHTLNRVKFYPIIQNQQQKFKQLIVMQKKPMMNSWSNIRLSSKMNNSDVRGRKPPYHRSI